MRFKGCAQCKHWDAINDDVGLCRRNPPKYVQEIEPTAYEAVWPQTKKQDWCGEYSEQSTYAAIPPAGSMTTAPR